MHIQKKNPYLNVVFIPISPSSIKDSSSTVIPSTFALIFNICNNKILLVKGIDCNTSKIKNYLIKHLILSKHQNKKLNLLEINNKNYQNFI